MRRLHWVRHGPTHATGMIGWSDIAADLTDKDQIARLTEFLPQEALVVSSDLRRASTTGDAIAAKRRRLPHLAQLREINFGDWEGRRATEIEAENPTLIREYWERPGDVRPNGGESWNEVCARVNGVVDDLCERHDGDLILVAHFGVILTQVQRALGVDAYTAFSHRIDNFSVTTIARFDQTWQVERINHVP